MLPFVRILNHSNWIIPEGNRPCQCTCQVLFAYIPITFRYPIFYTNTINIITLYCITFQTNINTFLLTFQLHSGLIGKLLRKNLLYHRRIMDVTRALSIAQEELKDYNLEGECLSLYDGSDFINHQLFFTN